MAGVKFNLIQFKFNEINRRGKKYSSINNIYCVSYKQVLSYANSVIIKGVERSRNSPRVQS